MTLRFAVLLCLGMSACCFSPTAAAPPSPSPEMAAPQPALPTAAPAAEPTPPPDSPPASPPIPLAELAAIDANPLVRDCLNNMGRRLLDARSRYGQAPPSRRHTPSLSSVSQESVQACRAARDLVVSAEPVQPELDAAANAYVEAIEALAPIAADADMYYSRENYRDDQLAHGLELHPRLIEAFETFATAYRELSTEIEELQGPARASRLARFAADPELRGAFLVERTLDQAAEIASLYETVNVERGVLVTNKQAELAAATQAFRAGVDELMVNAAILPDASRSSNFVGTSNDAAVAAVNCMRRIRDRERLSTSEVYRLGTFAGWMTEGTPDKFMHEYNDMLRGYNR